ncbi:hypothetical protein Agub_g7400, partial [Astrephomene gubernaculifera]
MERLVSLLVLCLAVTAKAGNPFALQERKLSQCEALAFAELTPTNTRAPVLDLQWVGADDQTVFAITHKAMSEAGGLWRSKDGGKTFKDLTSTLNATLPTYEPFSVMAIYSQKSSPGNILLMGTGTYMWTSSDYGETLSPLPTPSHWRGSSIRSAKLHPWHDNWLLLLVKRPACKTPDPALMECPYDLMLNQDVFNPASPWKNLTADSGGKIAGFVDFDWAANLCPNRDTCGNLTLSDSLIFATMYARPDAYDQPWDPDVNFVTSTDWFASFSQHVRCGNMFELVGRSVYLAFANSCPTEWDGSPRASPSKYPRGITLLTSIDGGNTFVQACLPVALNQDGYELVETHDGRGAVVIVDYSVDAGFMALPASSVYTAGPHHALFSLSLTNVFHTDFGTTTDFARVEGVPGIYIANQMLATPGSSSSSSTSPAAAPGDYLDYTDLSDLTEQPVVESRITFNGGASWQRIPAPTQYRHPACNRCGSSPGGPGGSCFLHLHGLSAWDNMGLALPAVYSNPSAPGLVMATGNVGPLGQGLDGNDGLCTWLSTDGGVSWTDVAVGAYIYEFADWGGVIVMARHPGVNPTSPSAAAQEILFSLDYGECWQSVPLSEALLVENVRIEPDGQRPTVLVHGRACRKSDASPKCSGGAEDTSFAPGGVLYAVDVADLMRAKLSGSCGKSDYERWTVPTFDHQPRCVLGEKLQLERRKSGSRCLNGGAYSRPPPDSQPCECSLDGDTECDYGFLRDNKGCTRVTGSSMPTCPVIESGLYRVDPSGRRIVHGDVCSNPQAVIPQSAGGNTDNTGGGSSSGGGGDSGGRRRSSSHHSGWFGFLIFLLVG